LFFVLPGLLGLQERVENIFTRLHSTEDIIAGSNPLEKLNIRVVLTAMVGNIGQIHPHWLEGFLQLKNGNI
jgi:hypothetical protein